MNSVYIIVEFIYGISINSMALIADSGHNLSDVFGLTLAWGATILARKASTKKRTYGYGKSTILAAMLNSLILLIAVAAIGYSSVMRIITPAPVIGNTMMIVASIGVVINVISAWFFMKGRKSDLNIKGAFLHMAADAAVSAAVVIGGLIINITGFAVIDPILGLAIAFVILFGTWNLLKDSFNMAMDAVPFGIELSKVKNLILDTPGLNDVHDLHIWNLSTTEIALSAHVVKSGNNDDEILINQIVENLHKEFGIHHSTIQIEKEGTLSENHIRCD